MSKFDNWAGVFSSDKYWFFICLSTSPLYLQVNFTCEPQCEVFIGSLTCQLWHLHNVMNRKDINGFVLTQMKLAVSEYYFWHQCLILTSDCNIWFTFLTPMSDNHFWHQYLVLTSDTSVWFSLLTSMSESYFCLQYPIQISNINIWFSFLTSISDSHFWHHCLILTSNTSVWFSFRISMSDSHF